MPPSGIIIERTERFDYETTVTQANANDVTVLRIPGLKRPGLVGVRIVSIATDKGARTGAVITTVYFKAEPDEQKGLMGGDREHTFSTLDTQQQNAIPFGTVLNPNEDLVLYWTNGTAARSVQARVNRELLFGRYAEPAPAAPRA